MTELVWWAWPIILFFLTFIMGIFAVLAGVGGGVIFVPVVCGFFPFHIDFVRGTGLIVALTSSLFAGSKLLKHKLVNLRLVIPIALVTSFFAVIGAYVGFLLPEKVIKIALGIIVLGITVFMFWKKSSDTCEITKGDRLSQILGIHGMYFDESLNKEIEWNIHRTPLSLALFAVVGLIAGIFGLGAGWANVPILNILMGLPLKMASATSGFVVSIGSSSAVWVYLNKGAVIPLVAVPSILGMALGARLGARLITRTKPKVIRLIVIIVLAFAGFSTLIKGILQ